MHIAAQSGIQHGTAAVDGTSRGYYFLLCVRSREARQCVAPNPRFAFSTRSAAKTTKEASQNPDNVKLNLVVEGSGTVWIDDIRLEKVGL